MPNMATASQVMRHASRAVKRMFGLFFSKHLQQQTIKRIDLFLQALFLVVHERVRDWSVEFHIQLPNLGIETVWFVLCADRFRSTFTFKQTVCIFQ